MSAITLRQAYDKGQRSRNSQLDWDVALERFSERYCEPHSPMALCALESAWCDGWDDGNENVKTRRPEVAA